MASYLLEVSNDGKIRIISKRNDLLMDHKSKDSHHGGTAVVELNGTLGKLGLLIKINSAEVNVSIMEVTNMFIFGSLNIILKAHSNQPMKAMIWTSPAVGMESGLKRAATPLG